MANTRAKVEEQNARLIEAYNTGNFQGFADVFAEECHFLPPGSDGVSGRKNLAANLEEQLQKRGTTVEMDIEEILGEDGDRVIVWRNAYRLKDADGNIMTKGRGIMVNKKIGTDYKVYINIWNTGKKD